MNQRGAIAALSLLIAATPASAIEINALRLRAVGAVVDCLFASSCQLVDLGDDDHLSSADVVAAERIPQADPAAYARVEIAGDPSASGVFDASLLFPNDSEEGWMAYSGVDYHEEDGFLVRDVTTRLGSSSDGGMTWQTRATINPLTPATITVRDTSLCEQSQCTGHMISEVPFLVDDPTDPNRQRRFKLLAHRYFIYPPAAARGEDLQRALGSINLRTAPSLAGPWSDDDPLLGWNLTPPEVQAAININRLGGLESCLALSEGDAAIFNDEVDLVFTCPHLASGGVRQRIVLLRSADHLVTMSFVATVLDDDDALSIGAEELSAPSLFTVAGRAYLLVTPVTRSSAGGQYAGCVVIAFSNRRTGEIERDRVGHVVARGFLPTQDGRFGGACAWNAGAAGGIAMSQLFFDGALPSFRLFDTGARQP
jgi:hypothetical protein